MADRTTVTLHLLDVPETSARAVLDILDRYELSPVADDVPADTVALGSTYEAHSVYGDTSESIAADLAKHAPDVAFRVETHGCQYYSGVGVVRLPGRPGMAPEHRYETDIDGGPIVAVEVLIRVQRMDELRSVIGARHFDAAADRTLELSRMPLPERLVPMPLCDRCETRTRCSCEEDAEDEAWAMNAAAERVTALG